MNPAADIERVKEAPGRLRLLTPEERDLLLNGRTIQVQASDGRTWSLWVGPDDDLRLYITLALHTGGRRSELIRLMWADVDLRHGRLTFHATKTKHPRTVPLTETAIELLAQLPRSLDRSRPVLPPIAPLVLTRKFSRLVQRLGLANLTFHDLRHACASYLTMAGVSQRAVMEILGHRDPRMSVRYQHLTPGHLTEAMRKLEVAITTRRRSIASATRLNRHYFGTGPNTRNAG